MARDGNYEISKREAEKFFLTYDQQKLIDRFSLSCDKNYLYSEMLGRQYRIGRTSAAVESSCDGFCTVREGDFEETLSLFDLLCYGNGDICPCGEWALVNSLPGTPRTIGVATGFYTKYADFFSRNIPLLHKACRNLNAVCADFGDIGYEIPVFRRLSVIMQFYEADEDFPAQLNILWDKHTLQYVHYETTFYIAGLLMERLMEEAKA